MAVLAASSRGFLRCGPVELICDSIVSHVPAVSAAGIAASLGCGVGGRGSLAEMISGGIFIKLPLGSAAEMVSAGLCSKQPAGSAAEMISAGSFHKLPAGSGFLRSLSSGNFAGRSSFGAAPLQITAFSGPSLSDFKVAGACFSIFGLGLGAASTLVYMTSDEGVHDPPPGTQSSSNDGGLPDDPKKTGRTKDKKTEDKNGRTQDKKAEDKKDPLTRIEEKLDKALVVKVEERLTVYILEKGIGERGARIVMMGATFVDDIYSLVTKAIFAGAGLYSLFNLDLSPGDVKNLCKNWLERTKTETHAELKALKDGKELGPPATVMIELSPMDVTRLCEALKDVKDVAAVKSGEGDAAGASAAE